MLFHMLGAVLVLACLATASGPASAWTRIDGARVRSAPKTKSRTVIRLPAGHPVQRVGPEEGEFQGQVLCEPARGPWVKVRSQDGSTGWIWEPLLTQEPPKGPARSVHAVIAFRSEEEQASGAFEDLFEAAERSCSSVSFVRASPAKACILLPEAPDPITSVDLTRSFEAQGQGFILRKTESPSRFLPPTRAALKTVAEFCQAESRPEVPPLRGSQRILRLDPSEWSCAWTMHTPDPHRAHVLTTTRTCPKDITWTQDHSKVAFWTEDALVTMSWPLGEDRKEFSLRGFAEETQIASAWIEPGPGSVRLLLSVPAQVEEGDGVATYSAWGKKARVHVSEEDGRSFFLVEGRPKLQGTENQKLQIFPWGVPSMAFVVEHRRGTWVRVAWAPTSCGASDVPCADVLADFDRAAARFSRFRVACNDSDTDCYADEGIDQNPKLLRALNQNPDEPDRDSLGFIPWRQGGLLFVVAFGDTPHAMQPLHGCLDAGCQSHAPIQLPIPSDVGLTVAPRGEFLLVGPEWDSHDSVLLRATKQGPRPIATLRGAAHWLPAQIPGE